MSIKNYKPTPVFDTLAETIEHHKSIEPVVDTDNLPLNATKRVADEIRKLVSDNQVERYGLNSGKNGVKS